VDILAAIGKLKSNLSAGPDGLPLLLFKRVKLSIALPLTLAFRQLLSVSYVPEDWKSETVTPQSIRKEPQPHSAIDPFRLHA